MNWSQVNDISGLDLIHVRGPERDPEKPDVMPCISLPENVSPGIYIYLYKNGDPPLGFEGIDEFFDAAR